MNQILLHPDTRAEIDSYLVDPVHALLISGQSGAGKLFLAEYVGSRLFEIDPNRLNQQPYLLHVQSKASSIGIDDIRNLHNFLKLRTTGQQAIRRLIIIENAHLMT